MECNKAEGSNFNPLKFRNQDYESLRDECMKSGTLFSDPLFAADQSSIGLPADPDPKNAVKWMRPKDINKDAVFIEDTTGTTDICQGQLGNCWLLAALSSLTMHPTLFAKVVPSEQSLSESYAGIFHFKFWQYGEWVEVVVDDLLPVRSGRLLFNHSRTLNEFWSALVEKAYAKMIGCYGSLKGGNISEGMEDFTGGIARAIPVKSRTPTGLWKILTASLSRGTLLSCFIQAANLQEIGTVNVQGLVKGHAYAITNTDRVQKKSGEVLLLRLRNPWGFVEYSGPWSDKCKNWNDVDSAEKKRIQLIKAEDGEFWISVEDFRSLFDSVELCSVSPDCLSEEEIGQEPLSSTWTITSYQGSWVPGCTAGGSSKFPRSFWRNPQFRLVLSELDDYEDEDESPVNGGGGDTDAKGGVKPTGQETPKPKEKTMKCTMVAEVLQKNRRQKDKINFLQVAFHVYQVDGNPSTLDEKFFSTRKPVASSGSYQSVRGVRRKVRLNPGNYVVVVSTSRPDQAGDFFLRLFAKSGNTLGDLDSTCSSNFNTVVQSQPVAADDYKRVEELFIKEAGADERLDALELMKLLNSVLNKDYHLPLETCRQLIFAEDTGGRSRLTLPQTVQLLSSLRKLQSIFLKYDEDSSGTMSPFDLSLSLQAAGLQCSRAVQEVLWERVGAGLTQLPFYGFISCVARLRVLFALYESERSQEVRQRGINAWLLKFLTV
ncbi:calpain-12 [Paramormyrops kingsleyae]|uniref:Calpain 12 n=1 Tax=Paramormyrops kingsleyae TaxID=1676925 RepID=A0A3B3SIV3_9TELE|nr:calpain-1 catalytic subunit-like [Paramormyrops kingsleyae]